MKVATICAISAVQKKAAERGEGADIGGRYLIITIFIRGVVDGVTPKG